MKRTLVNEYHPDYLCVDKEQSPAFVEVRFITCLLQGFIVKVSFLIFMLSFFSFKSCLGCCEREDGSLT